MKFLFATGNPAKVRRYGERLLEKGIEIVTLQELGIEVDVDETGKDPVENAVIKAEAYHKISGLPTIAMDDGLYLDAVPEEWQPGTHVRRVGGKRLNDEEVLAHYVGLVNRYGTDGKLTGYFIKGVAVATECKTYRYGLKTPRCFCNQQSEMRDEGYPLASIQIVEPFQKFKSELTKEEEEIVMEEELKGILAFIEETVAKIEEKQ